MNQMGIPAGLQAVLNAANAINPVSSTGQPTVAAQVMGAAEQAGMSDATAASRASLGPANQRLEDERMQDILQRLDQSRAQPAGIEGLPAPNMEFADGGVVGFASQGYVDPEAYDINAAINLEREIMRQLAQDRAQRTQRPAPRQPAPPPVAAPVTGIAGLTEYDKKAAEAREEAEKRLKEPFARKAPTLEEIQAQTDKARQARGLMGAPGAHMSEQIAAFKELIAQQEAERAAGARGRNLADLAAILSAGGKGGLRAVGERHAQISQTRAEEAERLRAQQVTQKQAVFAMQNAQVAMQEAAATGDMNAYRTAQQDFAAAQRAYETARTTGLMALAKEHGDVARDMATRDYQQRQLAQQAQLAREQMTAQGIVKPGETETLINRYMKANPQASFAEALRAVKARAGDSGTRESLAILRTMQSGLQTQLKNAPTSAKPAIQADLLRVNRQIEALLGEGAGESAPSASKTMTRADVAATAKASGKTEAEVEAAARARGYTIQ